MAAYVTKEKAAVSEWFQSIKGYMNSTVIWTSSSIICMFIIVCFIFIFNC